MEDGKEKIPNVYFRAQDSAEDDSNGKSTTSSEGEDKENDTRPWIRWSSSTETGDFIRDAARVAPHEFVIEIEGHKAEMRVAVPSFEDRTQYMRGRLRYLSRRVDSLAEIKRECDDLAHRSAYRLAQGGFALLSAWWAVVYFVTFHTELGWRVIEPVTYLAGLTAIMAGYLWFLLISKDLSYKAAMNLTVTRRQNALYEARGFDPHKWEALVSEANTLRSEIRTVAAEYDVDWDDSKLVGEEVKEVLDREKRKRRGKNKDDDEDDDRDEKEKKSKESQAGEKDEK
jgi:hypothetical protein